MSRARALPRRVNEYVEEHLVSNEIGTGLRARKAIPIGTRIIQKELPQATLDTAIPFSRWRPELSSDTQDQFWQNEHNEAARVQPQGLVHTEVNQKLTAQARSRFRELIVHQKYSKPLYVWTQPDLSHHKYHGPHQRHPKNKDSTSGSSCEQNTTLSTSKPRRISRERSKHWGFDCACVDCATETYKASDKVHQEAKKLREGLFAHRNGGNDNLGDGENDESDGASSQPMLRRSTRLAEATEAQRNPIPLTLDEKSDKLNEAQRYQTLVKRLAGEGTEWLEATLEVARRHDDVGDPRLAKSYANQAWMRYLSIHGSQGYDLDKFTTAYYGRKALWKFDG
ncbi:hypothetical protein K491DRAFT_738961 [Lophiostoma macrostomum CBS 122681]|uniref:Uncharacterized protein n=1 Tax=Lophiostoma macrostomum CBS 122681 TaxID=1314788 RepID=A0A6A6TEX7_9PLEO|nr:hypothetical protein K491DRAFT_738961 [Lophiostoma macrostomum CBS 122681]